MSEHLAYFAGGSTVHSGRRRDCTDMVCFEEEEWCQTGRARCPNCDTLITARVDDTRSADKALQTLLSHRCPDGSTPTR